MKRSERIILFIILAFILNIVGYYLATTGIVNGEIVGTILMIIVSPVYFFLVPRDIFSKKQKCLDPQELLQLKNYTLSLSFQKNITEVIFFENKLSIPRLIIYDESPEDISIDHADIEKVINYSKNYLHDLDEDDCLNRHQILLKDGRQLELNREYFYSVENAFNLLMGHFANTRIEKMPSSRPIYGYWVYHIPFYLIGWAYVVLLIWFNMRFS